MPHFPKRLRRRNPGAAGTDGGNRAPADGEREQRPRYGQQRPDGEDADGGYRPKRPYQPRQGGYNNNGGYNKGPGTVVILARTIAVATLARAAVVLARLIRTLVSITMIPARVATAMVLASITTVPAKAAITMAPVSVGNLGAKLGHDLAVDLHQALLNELIGLATRAKATICSALPTA